MRRSRYTEEQIVAILKEHEAGLSTEELCRRHGISQKTFYRWKAKYGGLELGDAPKLKALEDENRRLKRLVADLALDNAALKDVLSKTGKARGAAFGGPLPGSGVGHERASCLRAGSSMSRQRALSGAWPR